MATNERVERLCDEADEALGAGDADRALELMDEALSVAPKHGVALLLKAEALYAIEADEDAEEAVAAALKQQGKDAGVLLRAAAVTLNARSEEHEAVEQVLELLERAERVLAREPDPTMTIDLLRLRARSLSLLDDLDGAGAAFEKALAMAADDADPELLIEVAIARFELRHFAGAAALLDRADDPDDPHPDIEHYRGLIAEFTGRAEEAERHFAKARALDPEAFPEPVRLTEQEFEAAVETALEKVPESVRQALSNVPIVVESVPNLEELKGPPALSPLSLGMFRGPVGPGAEAAWTVNAPPNDILLFQRNLERYAESREELIAEIEDTLLHEIGHFVGWDEDELYERGLH
jgi:predicted Zn-dependent protease with MMP-like domain/Flp pilus assembly protein TadD